MADIDDLEQVFSSLASSPTFRQRPDPVPADLRISWRFAAVVLVLRRCRGQTAPEQQLHLLTSALRSPTLQNLILRTLAGGKLPGDIPFRSDPSLARTIRIGIASGLLRRSTNGNVTLGDDGLRLVKAVTGESSVMEAEKTFLDRLPGSITQKSLSPLLRGK